MSSRVSRMLQVVEAKDLAHLQSEEELALRRARKLVDALRSVYELEAQILHERPKQDRIKVRLEPPRGRR